MKLKINFILSVVLFAGTFSSYGQSFNFSNPIRVDSIVDYDFIDNTWVLKTKRDFAYKTDSNLISENFYFYDQGWKFDQKFTYSFNTDYILRINILDLHRSIDSVIYDNRKIKKHIANFIVNSNDEIYLSDIKDFIYDTKGNLKTIVHSVKDDNRDYVDNSEVFIYNLDNKLSEYSEYYFNELGDTTYHNKKEYIYKENGNVEILHLNILGISITDNKQVQIYDNGNLIENLFYNYTDGTWLETEKIEYIYDPLMPNFKISEFIDYTASESIYYEWDKELNNWVPINKTKVFYSKHDLTNSIKPVSAPFVQIYPNPVVDRVNFKFEDSYTPFVFELSDLNGKNVITQKVAGNEQISLEALAKGVYIYRITNSNGEIKSGKLIKN
jgi:hypothetical protein